MPKDVKIVTDESNRYGATDHLVRRHEQRNDHRKASIHPDHLLLSYLKDDPLDIPSFSKWNVSGELPNVIRPLECWVAEFASQGGRPLPLSQTNYFIADETSPNKPFAA